MHTALAAAPSRVLLATLDDALAVEERPNIPGAGEDFPNWSTALPVFLDQFDTLELPRQISEALGRRGQDQDISKSNPLPVQEHQQPTAPT